MSGKRGAHTSIGSPNPQGRCSMYVQIPRAMCAPARRFHGRIAGDVHPQLQRVRGFLLSLKAFVSRVNRRMCIRVKLLGSA